MASDFSIFTFNQLFSDKDVNLNVSYAYTIVFFLMLFLSSINDDDETNEEKTEKENQLASYSCQG